MNDIVRFVYDVDPDSKDGSPGVVQKVLAPDSDAHIQVYHWVGRNHFGMELYRGGDRSEAEQAVRNARHSV